MDGLTLASEGEAAPRAGILVIIRGAAEFLGARAMSKTGQIAERKVHRRMAGRMVFVQPQPRVRRRPRAHARTHMYEATARMQ